MTRYSQTGHLFAGLRPYLSTLFIMRLPQRTIFLASLPILLGTSGYAADSAAPAITMPAAIPAINDTVFKIQKERTKAGDVLMRVYEAMSERGYDPVNQIVGYLISGDPTYITSYNNARYLIRMLERDELLEELVKYYVESHGPTIS